MDIDATPADKQATPAISTGQSVNTGAVPTDSCIAVDIPVIVKSTDRAVALLGGVSSIARALARGHKGALNLWLRPDDPTSHPIEGKKAPCNQFLLRVEKSAKGSVVAHQIIGDIKERWQFSQLADFQYLPNGLTLPVTQQDLLSYGTKLGVFDAPVSSESAVGNDSKAVEDGFLLLPRSFSPVDMPQPYHYRVAPSVKQEPPPSAAVASSFHDAEFSLSSTDPVPSSARPTAHSEHKPAAIKALHEAFEARPVWQLHALEHHLTNAGCSVPRKHWRIHLPAVAYFARSGCFQLCWIRLGYDPRSDPLSRIYQAIAMLLPDSLWRTVSPIDAAAVAAADAEEGDIVVRDTSKACLIRFGGSNLLQRTVFQLIDLVAEGLGCVLQNCEITASPLLGKGAPHCVFAVCYSGCGWLSEGEVADCLPPSSGFNDRTGWLTADSYAQLRIATQILAMTHISRNFALAASEKLSIEVAIDAAKARMGATEHTNVAELSMLFEGVNEASV